MVHRGPARRGRLLPAAAALAVPLVLAAGCATGPARGYGLVSGLAAPCVGIALPGTASVTVYARHNGQAVKTQRVVLTRSPGNQYQLRLAAGQYVINASGSGLPGQTVNVRPGETVRLNFLPSCK